MSAILATMVVSPWLIVGVTVYVCLSIAVATCSTVAYHEKEGPTGNEVFFWGLLLFAWPLIALIYGTIKMCKAEW